jgi:DNA-binding protein H-NS
MASGIEELEAQKRAIDDQIKQIKKDQRKNVIRDIQDKINSHGIRASEIKFPGKNTRARKPESKPRATYKDPKSGESYKGRGRPPQWWKDAKANGTLDKYVAA